MTWPTTLAEIATAPPRPGPADWNDDGVVLLPQFFSISDIAPYLREWSEIHGLRSISPDPDGLPIIDADRPKGWPTDTHPCAYMECATLRALCCDYRLAAILHSLTGDDMAVNLNLASWVSTERNWHADTYLNEPEVGDTYAAVWIALADIHPDAGPFEYVPGSHRWPQITRDAIGDYFDLDDPMWPKHSEQLLTELYEAEIQARGAEVIRHIPKAGDVLIWHPRLLHRGSVPARENVARPALIAHYSGVHHRSLFPHALAHENGGWYFPIEPARA